MMHVIPPKRPIMDLIEEIAAGLEPFPVFPDCFGPRDRSPYINYNTLRLLDPIAEAERTRVRVCARHQALEAMGKGGFK